MARRVFYSFHYQPDCSRAAQVRNMGAIEGNQPASDNDWESITNGGDAAIKRWIAEQMTGRSCCVVLIGQNTADRKWINHEISKAWNDGKGVVGIHIHNLKNLSGYQSYRGLNPLDYVTFKDSGLPLSTVAKAYDPPYSDSKDVYGFIANNIEDWIEEAVGIRSRF